MTTITKPMTEHVCKKRLLMDLATHPRYEVFTFLNEPTNFSKRFTGYSYDVVRIFDMSLLPGVWKNMGDAILGYVGEFEWKNNTINPLDGDAYTHDTIIWGYDEWTINGIKCLDILAEQW